MDFGTEISKIMPLILREVTRKQMRILAKDFLAIPHIIILDLLLEKGPCRMTELAKALGLTGPAITAIADKMLRLKLVKRERSSEDRRVVKVSILEKGEKTIRRINVERRDAANAIFSPLAKEERREYLSLLRKVYLNLRQKQ